jgi:serine/threonine protein kinase
MTSKPPSERPSHATAGPETSLASGDPTVPATGPLIARLPDALFLQAGLRLVPEYQLVQRLSAAGPNEVWKAQGSGGYSVALKFLRLGDQAGAVELRSLEVMKDIRHPHLLGILGGWQRDGFLIIGMELADQTLAQRLAEVQREGLPGIPAAELMEYMRDAAQGIDYLNSIGVQHRNIKPPNLLLVGGGCKVGDFGLVKLLRHAVTSNSGSMTPAYAAPEFLQGQTSGQSDQYALGVTYCQLRGGRLPFTGHHAQVLTGHLMSPPDLTMIPEAERTVVERALAKKPEDRWPSCRAFVDALMPCIPGIVVTHSSVDTPAPAPLPAPPPVWTGVAPKGVRWEVVAVSVLLALTVAAAVLWILLGP